ncbi:T9SS type A sorting domain-containing protein [Parasediminibacterium sp. JCM 36343]|uniref:T9SS type A sorting domain-containing protein n=1 Tax=Parasediminibacterium sp. JCM 36343 TaxID=3374279 RepID=UPI00397BC34A
MNVAATGKYTINTRVATALSGAYHLLIDGVNVTGTVNVASTGGWSVYTTVSKNHIALTAGSHVLRYYHESGSLNVNWHKFIQEVQLFKDCNYGGTWSAAFVAGTYYTANIVAAGGVNNDASSIRIPAGYSVVLYDGDSLTGTSLTLTADVSCLTSLSFNDKLSSMSITSTSNATHAAAQSFVQAVETAPDQAVTVYPNPAKNYITLQNVKNSVIYIVSSTGKQVIQTTSAGTSTTLNIAGLSNGMYYIKVVKGEESVLKKLIINK